MTLKRWYLYMGIGMSLLSLFFYFTPFSLPVVLFGGVAFVVLWVTNWHTISHFTPPGGVANFTTLLRLLLLLGISFFADRLSDTSIFLGLLLVVSLDGVDGYLARRLKQQSEFGGLFDTEVDAFFVVLVTGMLLERGYAMSWLVIIGWVKYYFVVFTAITQLNSGPEKRSWFGATVAVILFIALIFAFILPEKLRSILLLVAAILLGISFAKSLVQMVIYKLKNNGY